LLPRAFRSTEGAASYFAYAAIIGLDAVAIWLGTASGRLRGSQCRR
jgi:hypothetical protein